MSEVALPRKASCPSGLSPCLPPLLLAWRVGQSAGKEALLGCAAFPSLPPPSQVTSTGGGLLSHAPPTSRAEQVAVEGEEGAAKLGSSPTRPSSRNAPYQLLLVTSQENVFSIAGPLRLHCQVLQEEGGGGWSVVSDSL